MKRMISTSMICIALVGCNADHVVTPEELRAVPAEAMQLCPEIKPLEGDTMGDLVDKLKELGDQYKGCKSLHKQLIEFVEGNGAKK